MPKWIDTIWSLMNQATKLTNRVFIGLTAIVIGFSFSHSIYWWQVLYHGASYGLLLYLMHRKNISRSKKYKL